MNYRKKQRDLLRLDYIIFILSIISLFIYTTLFVLASGVIKYLFLVFGLFTLYTFTKAIFDIIEYYRAKRIKKYNYTRVNLKLFNTRKRKVKKAI